MSNSTAQSIQKLQREGHQRALFLLTKAMPMMQASALKHNYITSVCNVVKHPVAEIVDQKGARHIIGFGNSKRTLPLVVIREPEPDDTVRHAFVPSLVAKDNYDQPTIDSQLLEALQAYDDQWADRHQAGHRNIRNLISRIGRRDVNRHGINIHEPGPQEMAFDPELDRDFERIPWLNTDYIDPALDFVGDRALDTSPGSTDMRRIERNVTRSMSMVEENLNPRSITLHLKTTPKQPVLRTDYLDYSPEKAQFSDEPDY